MEEARYSIKDLEHFTRIKAHTIRIWEQRYGLLDPKRTDTNIRYYSEDDLKKILNINLLYNSGLKISKIAALSDFDIIDSAKEIIIGQSDSSEGEVNELIVSLMSFQGEKIKQQLETLLANKDVVSVYNTLIAPVLVRLGELWQVNSVDIVQEHYFSNIVREFVMSNIAAIHVDPETTKKAILFLHDEEEHEFSLLFAYYLLKKAGYYCYYMGQKVPIKELSSAINSIRPELILTAFTAKISEKDFKFIEKHLLEFSKKSRVLVSGAQLDRLNFSRNLTHVRSILELKTAIEPNRSNIN